MAPNPRQPPTDTSSFGPGPVGILINSVGQTAAPPKPKPKPRPAPKPTRRGQRDKSHSSTPQPHQDTGFQTADISPPSAPAGALGPTGEPAPAAPAAAPFPSGPPLASLQRYGVNLGIQDVNDRVDSITAAHLKLLGYKPTPEMVFDVLKAEGKTGPIDYNDLFGIPTSPQQAMSMIVSRQGTADEIGSLPIVTPTTDALVKGINQAMTVDAKHGPVAYEYGNSNTHDYLKENNVFIENVMKDPAQRDRLVHGLMQAGFQNAQQELPGLVQSAGWIPRTDTLGKTVTFAATTLGQIGYATTQMPFGFYSMARAGGLDEYNLALYGLHNLMGGDQHFDMQKVLHTAHILEAMGKGVYDDFNHPLRNSGYLTMDLWMIASAGVGGYARLAAAARAEGFRASARALVFKAPPDATRFRVGRYEESLPLSDTAVVRVMQKYFPLVGRNSRISRLAAEQTDGYLEGDTSPQALVNRYFSTPSMMRRARNKRFAIDFAVATTPAAEMQRLMRWDQLAKGVIAENFFSPKNWNRLTAEKRLGLERAMHLVMSDTVDPYMEWRHYHESQLGALDTFKDTFLNDEIDDEITKRGGGSYDEVKAELMNDKKNQRALSAIEYQIRAHTIQLDSLEAGYDMLMNPTKEFEPILDRAYQISRMQEEAKMQVSGLSPEIARQHLAEVGATLRGETIIPLGTGLKGVTLRPIEDIERVTSAIARFDKRIADEETVLARHRNTDRLHPGSRADEIAVSEDKIKDYKTTRDRFQTDLDTFRAEARPLHPAVGAHGEISNEWLTQDIQRKAKQIRAAGGELPVHFDEAHRGASKLIYTTDTPTGEPLARRAHVAPMDTEPDLRARRTRIDETHFRENTLNYVTALHELGHAAHYADPEATAYERFATDMIREVTHNSALPLAERRALRDKYFWLRELEREAEASTWAIKNSAEPMRHVVYEQMDSYLNSYIENAIRNGVDLSTDPLGPTFQKIRADILGQEMHEPGSLSGYADRLASLRLERGGSAYVPMKTERYRVGDKQGFVGWKRTRFGVRPPEFPIHNWTGDSLRIGDYRWDVSNLLSEQLGVTARAAQKMVQYQDLWNSAVDEPISPFHRPIRDISTIPDDLRNFVQQMERAQVNPRLINESTDGRFDDLIKMLYPTIDEVLNGTVQNDHVKYVDERLILDRMGGKPTQFWEMVDQSLAGTLGVVNEPMRLMLIFLSPAYALNALGSAALLMIHTGPMAPMQLGKAMMSHAWYGPETTRLIDRLAGSTHAASYEELWQRGGVTGKLGVGSHALQEGWSRITDTYFRRAAVIHELQRNGFLKTGDHETNLRELTDPANSAKRGQAAQTARKAMLDFNSLSWPERAVMRHLFFVYSFVRASGIWSLRFLRDHGVMSDALAQAGKAREQNLEDLIGPMPDWFMRAGYFAVHPGVIYNPIQWNMPGMLEQIMTPMSAIFGDTPYASAAELLGPGPVMALEILTGKDPQGHSLPGGHGSLYGSILDQWNTTPFGQIQRKQGKVAKEGEIPLPPEPVRSGPTNPITSAMVRERAGLNHSVFQNDGFWNQWGSALMRSGLPKPVNEIAGQARYWRDLRDKDPAKFHQHEMDMVMQMVHRQETVLGRPAPSDVTDAVNMLGRVSQAIEDYKANHKGDPTPNQKQINAIVINQLAKDGLLKNKQDWLTRNKNAVDATTIRQIHLDALYAAGGKAWKNWADEVNTVDNYAQAKFIGNVDKLNNLGLGDYTKATKQSRQTRWQYGREAERVLGEAKTLAAKTASLSGDQQKIAQQEWIRYVNENDRPVTVNGVEFPSPFAYQFAAKTTNEQNKAVAVYAKRSPIDTTAFQQELLTGVRPKPDVTQGWGILATWVKGLRSQVEFGKGLPRPPVKGGGTESVYKFYGDTLASRNKDFKQAWDFANQPLGKRLASYQTTQNSPYAADWNWLLGNVNQVYDDYKVRYAKPNGDVNQGLVTQAWKLRVNDVVALIHDRYPATGGFLNELGLYTGATSSATYDNYLSKFLVRLVAP